MPIEEALRKAQELGLDLVEVAPTAKPPVCRIMDFGKFLYQQKKKAHESKKKQKIIHVKEVKFRPNIDEHDYDFKLKNAVRFLEEGDKVKATVQFRGREMARQDLGHKLIRALRGGPGGAGSARIDARNGGQPDARDLRSAAPQRRRVAKKDAPERRRREKLRRRPS